MEKGGAYMVTAGTMGKVPVLTDPERRSLFQQIFFQEVEKFGWKLQAWAILVNHYHFVALAPGAPANLKPFLQSLHSRSARELNKLDATPGRRVWFQYWDTQLTYEESYLARLKYVHENPVRHQLVTVANQYPWCSAGWFETRGGTAFVKTVKSLKIDRVNVLDDF
jgi:putative transposase